jgi:hypothetical protein
MKKVGVAFLLFSVAILMAACSNFDLQPTEDTSYLMPIPEATLRAFKYGPVTTRLEAAITAINQSRGGHFGFNQIPVVRSVDKLALDEALKRRAEPAGTYENLSGWTPEVWFVVLEGEIQVYPPPPTGFGKATLPPPFHGCNSVMFGTNYPENGMLALGGITCPAETP